MGLKKKYFLILVFLGSLVFLYNLGARDLWEPDETRYAVVAGEMKDTGNWIVPHLNGAIYSEKPPLFFWLVNGSTLLLGDNEFANRLPSALAGLITVLVTFLLGARLFGVRTGFLSGLVLMTGFLFPQISRWMMLDSILTLFFLLSLFFFYQGYKREERRRVYYLVAGSFVGLGVLTKGPIAFLSIPIFLILGLLEKDVKKIWNRDLLWGVLVSLALVLAWVVPACWIGGNDYSRRILLEQSIGRMTGTLKHSNSHVEPLFFYFIRFPAEFLPWTFFVPAAVVLQLRKRKEERSGFLFLAVWFLFIFLFFSMVKGKNHNYILPLYPAAAILVGGWLGFFLRSPETPERFSIRLWNPIALTAVLFLTVWLAYQLSPLESFFPNMQPYLSCAAWPLTLAALGGALSLVSLLRRRARLSVFLLMGALIIGQTYLAVAVPLRFNELLSKKPFSRQILTSVGHEDELKIWKFQSTGLLYYTGRSIEQIRSSARLVEAFSDPRRVFVVVEKEDLTKLNNSIGNELLHPVLTSEAGRHTLYLFSNRAVENHEQVNVDGDRKTKGDRQTFRFAQDISHLIWRWLFATSRTERGPL
jgi:4-amino-4-deoxy-L-arabinose transferase-like glycosyltransferase